MKKLMYLFVLVAIVGALTGCATEKPQVALATPTQDAIAGQNTYTIAAFQDANSERFKKEYPDAAVLVRSAIEAAFIKYGKHVVKENGDIQITGIVTTYHGGTFLGGPNTSYTTVGIDIKATDVRLGALWWSASLTKRTKYYYDYDPAKWAQEVADELVKKVAEKTKSQ